MVFRVENSVIKRLLDQLLLSLRPLSVTKLSGTFISTAGGKRELMIVGEVQSKSKVQHCLRLVRAFSAAAIPASCELGQKKK